ncbi:MAG: calcium/sodium antiporter [Candidatus Andersenbacteria bacterium]|nr:calcium/sodium antiporter [Candidatus Andersenbacteria bacterium]
MMVGSLIFFVLGLVALIKGADLLVDGAGSLAKKFGVSELVIGLTVVAFGTSSPELVVNLLSAIRGSTELALGNIIGSNIANVLLILGVTAIIAPLAVKRSTIWSEIPLMLLASLAVLFLVNDGAIDGAGQSAVTRIDGLVLLLLFSIFLYYTYGISRVKGGTDNPDIKKRSWQKASLMISGGLAGLVLGGYWMVDSATKFATALGVSEAVIGLSIVAIGTSLPELATSVVAAWRKNVDIAVGNIVGSNIFNLLFILATTAVIRPLPLTSGLNFDLTVMIAAALLLFIAMFTGRKKVLERWEGVSFLALYAAYTGFLVIRG